jgi:SNF2 family DNA or RNA helicase
MPRIFDNISEPLFDALLQTLKISTRADFCVGYFKLSGWKNFSSVVASWSGADDECVRILVGMQKAPHEVIRDESIFGEGNDQMDNQRAIRLKNQLADEFRKQLTQGAPTNSDEKALRDLVEHLRTKRARVKLYLRTTLHAKLYLMFRDDINNPRTGFVGSSNLSYSGLKMQGELNVDVLDHDATKKLETWFNDRWNDRWCVDISDELIKLIEESWARSTPLKPYHLYVKMAYHLSREARMGLSSFSIPRDLRGTVLAFQSAAIRIAANHLNRRGGVILGDVVGLGKTIMATTLARIFEDDYGYDALVICPKRLEKMWQSYVDRYRLRAKIVPLTQVINTLPTLRRYRLMIIDESHNLRNREGRTYQILHEYIRTNECRCILLSATPYNKTYEDLSSQLRLFVDETKDLSIRPERLLSEIGEMEFLRRHQAPVRSLAAFEHSPYAEDWRELMRLYMVRRTRSFIKENYATLDPSNGRHYLSFEDGSRSYFPERVPKTVMFSLDENDKNDQYAKLFESNVVTAIDRLALPRYGLGNYTKPDAQLKATLSLAELEIVDDLSRAGKRLMGFCRTNLFKRLESGGDPFLLSMQRHVLRNYVFLHAVENGLPVPIGRSDAGMLEPQNDDSDESASEEVEETGDGALTPGALPQTYSVGHLSTPDDFKRRAQQVYNELRARRGRQFRWLPAVAFMPDLRSDLLSDGESLRSILVRVGRWRPETDAKLNRLFELLTTQHINDKVLVFTQFADTADYLAKQLQARGVERVEAATGQSDDPTELAWRFSPESNEKHGIKGTRRELRVLIPTDVLSEGQNLQDCAIVVNFDLPWAIIGLIQRAGRLDRIGQKAPEILCYSFIPVDGVERIIGLRRRVRTRLKENSEVIGTDEAFFEDEDAATVIDIYNEKANALDGEGGSDVDLSSYAYQIWKNAITADKALEEAIAALPDVVYATKNFETGKNALAGALVYVQTGSGEDALAWVNRNGEIISESQFDILRAAECTPDTPALERPEQHHELVAKVAKQLATETTVVGGQLGNPRGARFQVYERTKRYVEEGRLVSSPEMLKRALDEMYRSPLKPNAVATFNRQLRSGVSDQDLAQVLIELYQNDGLTVVEESHGQEATAQIICSMGLVEHVN